MKPFVLSHRLDFPGCQLPGKCEPDFRQPPIRRRADICRLPLRQWRISKSSVAAHGNNLWVNRLARTWTGWSGNQYGLVIITSIS